MTAPLRVALVPGCLALLPAYTSLHDPVPELRAAVDAAVSWLGRDVEIVATEQGRRVAESALAARTAHAADDEVARSVLVVLNGSACRTEKAPGYLDERAESFDADLGAALSGPDPERLRETDEALAQELWADVAVLPQLAALLADAHTVAVDHDAAPYGVQYWVLRWERER